MLPHVAVGYPVLHEGHPAGAAAPKSTQPCSPQRVPCYLLHTHSGYFAAPPHAMGLPPRMLQCLGCLFLQVGHFCGAHLCLLGPRSWIQSEQRGSAGSLGSGPNHPLAGRGSGREGPSRQPRGFENKVTSRQPKASQAPSIKFLTRKIVCPFLCNTPLGFFIMTSFPLVILERLYNCKSVIESNRISFGAWNAPCHGRSFRVK